MTAVSEHVDRRADVQARHKVQASCNVAMQACIPSMLTQFALAQHGGVLHTHVSGIGPRRRDARKPSRQSRASTTKTRRAWNSRCCVCDSTSRHKACASHRQHAGEQWCFSLERLKRRSSTPGPSRWLCPSARACTALARTITRHIHTPSPPALPTE